MRWIETQDVLFSIAKFERMVEIGPSPVLAGKCSSLAEIKIAYDLKAWLKGR